MAYKIRSFLRRELFMATNVEIEKKFVIKTPDISEISRHSDYTVSEIEQIYLESPNGITRRIRSRRFSDKTIYTETVKVRIDKMSASETECEISEERFLSLKERIAKGTVAILKSRHTFSYLGHVFEIDVYPAWKNTCIMEVEMESREEKISFPPFIEIVADVTGEKRYSNASMSRSFPEEITCDTSCR
jgi:CYTH domain-containing protein